MSTKIFKTIFQFLDKLFNGKFKSFVSASEALLKQNLGPLAVKAVQDAAALGLSGVSARDHAVAQVKQDGKQFLDQAVSSGLQIKDSFINLLVELALQKVQGSFAK
jgi:hypothetical protein